MVGFPGETEAEFEETAVLRRAAAVHLSARVHLLGASGHSGCRIAPGSGAGAQGAQPGAAGPCGCEEPRVPAVDGGTDIDGSGADRPGRGAVDELLEVGTGVDSRSASIMPGTGWARDSGRHPRVLSSAGVVAHALSVPRSHSCERSTNDTPQAFSQAQP